MNRILTLSIVALGLLAAPGHGQQPLPPKPSPNPGPWPPPVVTPPIVPAPVVVPDPPPDPPDPDHPPTIVGPRTVAEHSLVRLSIANLPPETKVAWDVDPVVPTVLLGQSLVWTGPPSTYKVIVFFTLGDQPTIARTSVTIAPGAVPTTPPAAIPASSTQPWALALPTFAPLWAVFVSDRTHSPAALASRTIAPTLAAPNIDIAWMPWYADDPAISDPRWQSSIRARGLPCAFLIDGAGRTAPLPLDEPGIVAAARKARGLGK